MSGYRYRVWNSAGLHWRLALACFLIFASLLPFFLSSVILPVSCCHCRLLPIVPSPPFPPCIRLHVYALQASCSIFSRPLLLFSSALSTLPFLCLSNSANTQHAFRRFLFISFGNFMLCLLLFHPSFSSVGLSTLELKRLNKVRWSESF
jgi:hypothetical protein